MSRVKIKLCTPLHIGSGNLLTIGTDVVRFTEKNGTQMLGVVDLHKVMQLIGNDRRNIDAWVLAIERGESTADVLKRLAPNADVKAYISREIVNYSSIKSTDTLKEFIHDGLNKPYIPGSSLKGAIRTAVLASIASNVPLNNIQYLENDTFGNNPQDSVFRFLSVGDAFIDGSIKTEALRLINLNERSNNSFIDTSKSQVTEVLPIGTVLETNIKCNYEKYLSCSTPSIPSMPNMMRSLENLFHSINVHTNKLLKYEIQFWEERKSAENADGVDDYIEQVSILLDEDVRDCEREGNSCILRVGHASGWNFITGGWARAARNFDREWVSKIRPNNNRYMNFDFPKSRRLSEDFDLLGFMKLTISSD